MAEVSYYSYEYDPDSEPFIADADGGDRFDFPDGGGDIATDIQLPVLDTKNTPERWYDPSHQNTWFSLLLLAVLCQLTKGGAWL